MKANTLYPYDLAVENRKVVRQQAAAINRQLKKLKTPRDDEPTEEFMTLPSVTPPTERRLQVALEEAEEDCRSSQRPPPPPARKKKVNWSLLSFLF
jgi:hypothetical protein